MIEILGLVCVVDNDSSLRRALARLIKSFGFKVQTFESTYQYLQWAQDNRPSCLVLDIVMPGMSGLQLLAKLGELNLCVPSIIISANNEKFAGKEAASCVACLKKPFDEADLHLAIDQALCSNKSSVDVPKKKPPAENT
jgi:FixJ family two-component response regulator